MHREGREYVAQVQRDLDAEQDREIFAIRWYWQRQMTDRERAIVLATYYDDSVIPDESPQPRRRWWWR